MKWMKLDPSQYSDADRRAIDPPIEVDMATWSPNGGLDWWLKERQQWWGRARSKTVVIGSSAMGIRRESSTGRSGW
jgi:hypothetical protein